MIPLQKKWNNKSVHLTVKIFPCLTSNTFCESRNVLRFTLLTCKGGCIKVLHSQTPQKLVFWGRGFSCAIWTSWTLISPLNELSFIFLSTWEVVVNCDLLTFWFSYYPCANNILFNPNYFVHQLQMHSEPKSYSPYKISHIQWVGRIFTVMLMEGWSFELSMVTLNGQNIVVNKVMFLPNPNKMEMWTWKSLFTWNIILKLFSSGENPLSVSTWATGLQKVTKNHKITMNLKKTYMSFIIVVDIIDF
jgi:hypothetical protein